MECQFFSPNRVFLNKMMAQKQKTQPLEMEMFRMSNRIVFASRTGQCFCFKLKLKWILMFIVILFEYINFMEWFRWVICESKRKVIILFAPFCFFLVPYELDGLLPICTFKFICIMYILSSAVRWCFALFFIISLRAGDNGSIYVRSIIIQKSVEIMSSLTLLLYLVTKTPCSTMNISKILTYWGLHCSSKFTMSIMSYSSLKNE